MQLHNMGIDSTLHMLNDGQILDLSRFKFDYFTFHSSFDQGL